MRGPPDEQDYTSRLPKKRLLIKPVPGDYHEGKQSIHHHHAGQSEPPWRPARSTDSCANPKASL